MNIPRNRRLEGLENFGVFQPYEAAGKYDIPVIAPVYDLKTLDWKSFKEARGAGSPDIGIHFFLDDYRFNSVWLQAAKYAGMFRKFGAVMSPDFSMYRDMPKALQIYNHYRKHWCAQYWQSFGAVVVPTISWSDGASFDWCFDGEPKSGIVAVSTVGVRRDKEAFDLFATGYSEMIDRLTPKRVIVCGEVFDFMAKDVLVERFSAFTDRFNNLGREN